MIEALLRNEDAKCFVQESHCQPRQSHSREPVSALGTGFTITERGGRSKIR